MALILTFLGSEGTDRTIAAIASAKRLAAEGKRVLLAFQDPGPAPSLLLGQPLSADPASAGENLQAVQFLTATLLERSWDEVKTLEAQYLRTPLLKSVYSQELGVLPGMDSALALNSLRQLDSSGQYDAIVYDGNGDLTTLRMLGMPEVLDWYVRRFRDVFQQSDLGRALGPFIPPVAATVLAVDWSGNILDRPTGEMRSILEEGKAAINDPYRFMALLVSKPEETAIATSRYLWGSAQQVGLTVGGVLMMAENPAAYEASFAPLSVYGLPSLSGSVPNQDWQPLIAALPDPQALAKAAPRSVTIDAAAGTVSLFLPSFDKSQVKLIQSGPEVTIEAGDQRRNLLLPPALTGRPVKGAKFQDQYLVLTFA
ncbi:ArsA family ATPase [Pseudanabaena sp. FACHB-2040]|uniref:Get3/ArsA fold putative tail anchor-mediating ATPase NosAFP n=1 Tax=Pseudanabaena sp. FACHB-2040 TaxID=2692859 RepID=UPI0016871D05|nr:ArsA family ATPase [Pseudanabaena sp. FACHB-2040]MBD2260153.1 ArsA family ATPase [Pseudanabaena sp. FACHB-2040]